MTNDFERSVPKFIRRVMPQASEAELREATATFDEYMAVVWEIFQRVKRDQLAGDSPKSGVCDRFDTNDPSV
jgi:hypothetical protein